MQKYAAFDPEITDRANLLGYYAEDVHGPRTIEVDEEMVPNPGTKIPTEAVELTDTQWRDSLANPGKYWVNPVTRVFEEAPPLPDQDQLDNAKAAKTLLLQAAAQADIASTFSSSVTGTVHHYDLADQANQRLLAATISAVRGRGGKIKCTPGGQAKAVRVMHTATQLQDLNDEYSDWVDSCYDRLDDLLDQVEAVEITAGLGTALATLDAINW